MSESTRPKRVVIVDADDPLVEVHGEFFWREDHERLLASAREAAFKDGYAEGYAAARSRPQRIVIRQRTGVLRRLVLGLLFLLVVVGFLTSLVASFTR
ncbi:hypothetical protein [Nocardioides terrisoli]|uniref:hypothetical protein n=1 Tax=Nocardioides terrisoli TaxID=3388267 RepID=UPI00287BAF49|nr:hypothetical protein [Nocardioides marmorisolisilvae]